MPSAVRLLLAVVLAAAVATPAAAAPRKNPKSPEATSAYWTAEKMKHAKPRERAKPGGGGGAPVAADWARTTVPVTGNAYTGENRKNGKVFFTLGTSNYVCSGTAVDAAAGINLVWTAGHCVTDGPGHDASNFMFVPGYYRGAEPNGRWTFTSLDSTPTWEGQGVNRFRADVGAARVVNPASSTATFANTIGTRPIAFGQNPAGKRLVSFGYPAARPFDGSQQYQCSSPFRRWDISPLLDPMQISCDMTGGSSGGGWMLDADADRIADAGEPLVSVNSYGYANEKGTMYGPYMPANGEAQALYGRMSIPPA